MAKSPITPQSHGKRTYGRKARKSLKFGIEAKAKQNKNEHDYCKDTKRIDLVDQETRRVGESEEI